MLEANQHINHVTILFLVFTLFRHPALLPYAVEFLRVSRKDFSEVDEARVRPKRAFKTKSFLLGFLSKFLSNLKTNFNEFELSTTFRFQDMTN